jgi:hypothetical protein
MRLCITITDICYVINAHVCQREFIKYQEPIRDFHNFEIFFFFAQMNNNALLIKHGMNNQRSIF